MAKGVRRPITECITYERLRERVHYDPETGIFTWKALVRPEDFHSSVKEGKVIGSKKTKGHLTISIDKKAYLAHQLAWLYMTGKWAEDQVDHENLIPGDNRWVNLRAATQLTNRWNRPGFNNKTGFKWVYANGSSYIARMDVAGADHVVGTFPTPEEAYAAACAFAKKKHGEFFHA